MICISSR